MKIGSILIVDDEPSIQVVLRALLKPLGHRVLMASSAEEALQILREEWCDLVISDLRMEEMDGLEFLRQAREEWPQIQFILMSAFGTMETVVEAMRLGAVDFMSKPLRHQELRDTVARLMQEIGSSAKANLAAPEGGKGLIGESDSLKQALELAGRAAQSDATVLLRGESGTGKEVFARWIHDHSNRSKGAFVALNCGAIPENIVESELFGHEKGSFTGAFQSKPGKFEMAQGGTLFLDEIAELPLLAQVKLLRVIQERMVERVGGSPKAVDFRLLAASHRNLAEMVKEGSFREDLFYRLNVIPIDLPPLRERGQDIIVLAKSILQRLNTRYACQWNLDDEHCQLLMSHAWPGNVRELENVLERSVVLSVGSRLNLALNPAPLQQTQEQNPILLSEIRFQGEKEAILQALEECRWNKTHTAEKLGISRRGLLYKIKALGIE